MLDSLRRGGPARAERSGELTPRQREVLQFVGEGRSAEEIAAILRIARRTTEFHRARLRGALGVESTAELVQDAIRTGLISV